MKKIRPRITPEEYEVIENYRRHKASEDGKFEFEDDVVTYESERIITLEDLIGKAEIDLDLYEVERHVVNSWEVTSWKRGFPEVRTNYQVKAWLRSRFFHEVDDDYIDKAIAKLAERLPVVGKIKSKAGKPLVAVIADLHAGGWTQNMKLVPDFNLKELKKKFVRLSQILNEKDRPTHLKILGDLIESFTGKNHKDTWKQIEQHGMKVVFTIADLIIWLLNETPCIKSVQLIAGNHDRISSSNQDDTKGQVAYAVYRLIQRSGFDAVEFDPLILSAKHDGVNYVLTHGHLGISKKNASEVVLDYGDQNCYNVILKGHNHNESVTKSTTKMKVHQCPSFVPANDYAEALGAHSTTGFLLYEANDYKSADCQSICI